jgi:GNAT superfamily N-acetyltransferase
LIDAGIIKKNKGSPEEEDAVFEIRYMDEDHLDEMMALQELIIESLADKEIFRTHSIDYFKDLFQVEKAAIGAFTEEGLIACSILQFPEEIEDNFGADVNLPTDDLCRVVHLAKVAVHPAFRGNSLQKKLQGIHLDVAREMGCYHACCMVSPKNRHSLQNMFSHGFIIKALKLKFGSRLRYILHKNLLHPNMSVPDEIQILSSNIAGQICLLNQGFLGFRLELLKDDFEISYGRVQALRSLPEFQYSNHCMSSGRRSFVTLATR